MSLSPSQRADATRLQHKGLLLREIARETDATFEDVCLYLYGGVTDWAPHNDQSNPVAKAGDEATRVAAERAEAEADAPDVAEPVSRGDEVGEHQPSSEPGFADAGLPAGQDPNPAGREPAPSESIDDQEPLRANGARYRLKSSDGQFLHEHERGLTRLPRFVWRGSHKDVMSLRIRKPEWRDLKPELITT